MAEQAPSGPKDQGLTLMYTLGGHTNSVNSVAWSPDGKTIASGSNDKTLLHRSQNFRPAQAREGFSPASTLPVVLPPTGDDQPPLIETPATTQSSLSTTVLAKTNPLPLTPDPVSLPVRYQRMLDRRAVFTLVLALFVALSGGGIYYFGAIARSRTLSPTQVRATAIAATAAAAVQAYATGTAKNGIMFGFDAAHTHNNPYENTLNPENVSQLKLLWSFSTGDSILSSPAVAGDIVYASSRDHKLYAFDASCRKTCQPLWSFSTGNWIISSPAVAGGIVYVGSLDHNLYAFGLAT